MEACAHAVFTHAGILEYCVFTKEMFAGLGSALLAILGTLLGAYFGGRLARRATADAVAAQQKSEERRERQELTLDDFAREANLIKMRLYRWNGANTELESIKGEIRALKEEIAFYVQKELPECWSEIFDTSITVRESSIDTGNLDANAFVAYLDVLTGRLMAVKNRRSRGA